MSNHVEEAELTDSSLMPFGKYKGVEMVMVPDEYLLWLFQNTKKAPHSAKVFDYIKKNLQAIQQNA